MAVAASAATLLLFLALRLGDGSSTAITLAGAAGIAALQTLILRRVLRLRQRLESAERRALRLGSDAAHELRTPIATARATLEKALRGPAGDSSDRDTIRGTLHDVQRLWIIAEGLLLLSRDTADRIVLDRRPVDLLDVLSETLALVAPSARAKAVRFVEEVDDELTILGDGDRLRLLLYKLLDNAVRFSPASGLVAVRLVAEGGWIRLRVEDSGPGIPRHKLRFLFDYALFLRGALPDRGAGSGLGLSLARWIAEAHGGTLEASNRAAGGSRFEVRLPASRQPPPPGPRADRP